MDGIAPIKMANLTAPAAPALDTSHNSFSTSASSSGISLDDILSELLTKRAAEEKSVTNAMANLAENPRDLGASVKAQEEVANLSISKSFEVSFLAKLKTTFEKIVISPS